MVARLTLTQKAGVRIPHPQPYGELAESGLLQQFAKLSVLRHP